MNQQQRDFERRRLELFEKFGTTMTPRRVKDRHERETYLLDSGG